MSWICAFFVYLSFHHLEQDEYEGHFFFASQAGEMRTMFVTSMMTSIAIGFMLVVSTSAKSQHPGDECNYKKNCAGYVTGVGAAWAGNRVTCAVYKTNYPETCGSKEHRGKFKG